MNEPEPLLELINNTISLYKTESSTYNVDGSFAVLDEGIVMILFKGDYDLGEKVKQFIAEKQT